MTLASKVLKSFRSGYKLITVFLLLFYFKTLDHYKLLILYGEMQRHFISIFRQKSTKIMGKRNRTVTPKGTEVANFSDEDKPTLVAA